VDGCIQKRDMPVVLLCSVVDRWLNVVLLVHQFECLRGSLSLVSIENSE
jgi:hypothetical protein